MLDYQYIKELEAFDEELKKMNKKEEQELIEHIALRARMLAMVIFFLASIYLCNLFASQMQSAQEDEDFKE